MSTSVNHYPPRMKTAKAAEYIGVTPRTLYRWCKAGLITYIDLGPREWRFNRSDLDKFLKDRTVEAQV